MEEIFNLNTHLIQTGIPNIQQISKDEYLHTENSLFRFFSKWDKKYLMKFIVSSKSDLNTTKLPIINKDKLRNTLIKFFYFSLFQDEKSYRNIKKTRDKYYNNYLYTMLALISKFYHSKIFNLADLEVLFKFLLCLSTKSASDKEKDNKIVEFKIKQFPYYFYAIEFIKIIFIEKYNPNNTFSQEEVKFITSSINYISKNFLQGYECNKYLIRKNNLEIYNFFDILFLLQNVSDEYYSELKTSLLDMFCILYKNNCTFLNSMNIYVLEMKKFLINYDLKSMKELKKDALVSNFPISFLIKNFQSEVDKYSNDIYCIREGFYISGKDNGISINDVKFDKKDITIIFSFSIAPYKNEIAEQYNLITLLNSKEEPLLKIGFKLKLNEYANNENDTASTQIHNDNQNNDENFKLVQKKKILYQIEIMTPVTVHNKPQLKLIPDNDKIDLIEAHKSYLFAIGISTERKENVLSIHFTSSDRKGSMKKIISKIPLIKFDKSMSLYLASEKKLLSKRKGSSSSMSNSIYYKTTFTGFIGTFIVLSENLEDNVVRNIFKLKGKYANFLAFSEANKNNYERYFSEEGGQTEEKYEKFFKQENKTKAEKKKEQYPELVDLIISPKSFHFVKEELEIAHSEERYYSKEQIEKNEDFIGARITNKLQTKKKIHISRMFNKDFHLFRNRRNLLEFLRCEGFDYLCLSFEYNFQILSFLYKTKKEKEKEYSKDEALMKEMEKEINEVLEQM